VRKVIRRIIPRVINSGQALSQSGHPKDSGSCRVRATGGRRQLSSKSNNRRGTLLLGLLLVVVGLIFFLAPSGSSLAEWLMRLWPVFLICAGIVRVMGFAVERKPKSPMGGMLLIIIGVLFLISRFHSDLNALQVYGRYWVLLLAVFAGVELVRYYSHRQSEGPAPRLFTASRIIITLFIVSTGVLASRAANNPSLLSAIRLPNFLSGLRDSVVGESYPFTDEPLVFADVRPEIKININNSFGNVKVTGGSTKVRATLTKAIRAWSQEDARKIADRIHLVMTKTPDGLTITTNRDEVNQQFTTHIEVEVPSSSNIAIADSYGDVSATGIEGNVAVKASHGKADLSNINGALFLGLNYSDVNASNINGDVSINGAKRARISGVTGALELSSSNGSVELREIDGPVHLEAPFSRISAQGLSEGAEIKTEHGNVDISNTGDVIIEAPHSDVRAKNIKGDLQISSSQGSIQLSSIFGELLVRSQQAPVSAEDLHGPVDIETSHGDVVVKNFYESVHIETSFKDVTLVTANQPTGDIEVENNHGEIKLVLPQSSQFELEASSENGQVKPVGFSELSSRGRDSLIAGLGDGPLIKLKTSYKNIIIQASGVRQTQASSVVN
jgi:DUF4097 and DUF4098 domain-containing protein YvlB/uncharacterized membrane protein HdeD (DUF308 family)